MQPAALDLIDSRTIYQGDFYKLDLYFFDPDGVTPLDLTDYSLPKSQVRLSFASTTKTDFTCAFDTDRTAGHVVISIDETDTALMAQSTTNVWDYEMVDPDGHTGTWYAGSATIEPQVTK